jgi:hypothetical protein
MVPQQVLEAQDPELQPPGPQLGPLGATGPANGRGCVIGCRLGCVIGCSIGWL